jgi:hypothetical protein
MYNHNRYKDKDSRMYNVVKSSSARDGISCIPPVKNNMAGMNTYQIKLQVKWFPAVNILMI